MRCVQAVQLVENSLEVTAAPERVGVQQDHGRDDAGLLEAF